MPINAQHIAPQGGGFEPQRTYQYVVEMDAPGWGSIKLALQSSSLPEETIGRIELNYGAERRYVAGQAEFTEIEIRVVDYVDQAIYSSLMEWRNLVYNAETGSIGNAADYKRSGSIIMYSPDESTQRIYTIEGCWPSRISPDQLDFATEDALRISMSVSIDRAIPTSL